MLYLILSILIQVILIIHVIKTGRNQMYFAAGLRSEPLAASRKRWIRLRTCAATRTRHG
jgi:hypothetical protein